MSVKLSSYVWDGCAAAGMKISKVAIMARLADFSNDEGVCWPSVTTISRQIGAGESTVRTALAELETDGWLSKKQRRAGNRNASNVYQLNVAKLKAAAHASESDTSKSDGSKSDGSKFDGSESSKSGTFDPPESGGDPSVNSKQDPSSKNTFGQPPVAEARGEDISKEIKFTDEAIEVLKHLNQLTGAKYTTIKTNLQNIRARLTDGHDKQSLILVVDYLVNRWLGTDWSKYLNPETMFRPTKFDGNLLAASAWHSEGRKTASQQAQATDHTERDAAYKRFISGTGQNVKPSQLEVTVSGEASKAGIRSMNASFAVQRWNAIWKECSQRMSGEKAA
ncbi:conserved phage C-terminal domain-containing protein [Yersinia alsatica]|uniref:conserved phage C-terminal domain-containing protein n=1 Tax=Yersinia alsatica TaxID=2890317 RepID=UPI0011AADF4C|nr:conserved phage C-terminal domain-containing protein [Yersinia alsatica]